MKNTLAFAVTLATLSSGAASGQQAEMAQSEQAPAPPAAAPMAAAVQGDLHWSSMQGDTRPTARHENGAVALNGRLYLFGGRGERPLDILDLETGQWTQGAAPPMEMNHIQAVTVDGKIWAVGAMNGPFPQENIIAQIQVYDTDLDKWSRGPDLPVGRERGGSAVVVEDGYLYLVGGNQLGHNAGYVAWADRLNLSSGEWVRLPDAPHARDHFNAVYLDGKIYAPGGRTSAADRGQPLELTVGPMDIFDVATGSWTTSLAPIPTPRAGLTAVAFGGLVITIGGESAEQQQAHAEVEAFDPMTGTWISLPPLPIGRHGTQAVVVGDEVQIVAGSAAAAGGPELNDRLVLSGFRTQVNRAGGNGN